MEAGLTFAIREGGQPSVRAGSLEIVEDLELILLGSATADPQSFLSARLELDLGQKDGP